MTNPSPIRSFLDIQDDLGRIIDAAQHVAHDQLEQDPSNDELRSVHSNLVGTRAKLDNRVFSVAWLALTKAGKSTVVNAQLGCELLPSRSIPETAAVVRVRHDPNADDGILELPDGGELCGWQRIQSYLREANAAVRGGEAPPSLSFTLRAPLASIADRAIDGLHLELLDTPGPDEAGGLLRGTVERLLRDADVVVYLFDFTKLKTDEEEAMLSQLASLRGDLIHSLGDRLHFAVNKVDTWDRNSLSVEETPTYVAELASRYLGVDVSPEQVTPISARDAHLARVVISGHATDEQEEDFARLLYGRRWAGHSQEELVEDAPQILRESGVYRLEERILHHVCEDRGRLFAESLVTSTQAALDRLSNLLNTSRAAMERDEEELRERIATLKTEMETVRRGMATIRESADQAEAGMERFVHEQFRTFTRGIEQVIEDALKEDPTLTEPRSRRLMDIIQHFLGKHSAGPEELQQKLRQLNQRIAAYLQSEFASFRLSLEATAWDRQREFFLELERELIPLASRIEEAVGEALDIHLEPVPIKVEFEDLSVLHDDIDRTLDRFFSMARRTRQVERSEDIDVASWCAPARYETRTWMEDETYEEHHIDLGKVRGHWLREVDRRSRGSSEVARRVVSKHVRRAAARAESALEVYANGYLQTMERELVESDQGEAHREARRRAVLTRMAELAELSDALGRCQDLLTRGTA